MVFCTRCKNVYKYVVFLYTKIDFLERELKIHRHTARAYLNALADD